MIKVTFDMIYITRNAIHIKTILEIYDMNFIEISNWYPSEDSPIYIIYWEIEMEI